jgi:hypothetical protein
VPAVAQPGSFTDPDDVNLPLDIKTVAHDNPGSSVVYTVDTFEAFEDRQVDFKWALDTNNDQQVDRLVSVEFEGKKLVAKVEDTGEKELGKATAERAGPSGLRVSFSRDLIGSASYQYRVTAVTDKNKNEEDDPGETDLAPDAGFHPHSL